MCVKNFDEFRLVINVLNGIICTKTSRSTVSIKLPNIWGGVLNICEFVV